MAMDTHATIEKMLETVFSADPCREFIHIRRASAKLESSHVEAGSNISTVVLQVVGGKEKGPQCLGV
jgi:hypothetical protein